MTEDPGVAASWREAGFDVIDLFESTPVVAAVAVGEPTLDKPAKVGGTRFGKGVKWSTVIGAAQRHYEYEVTPEKEAARIEKARATIESIQRGDYAIPPTPIASTEGAITQAAALEFIDQLIPSNMPLADDPAAVQTNMAQWKAQYLPNDFTLGDNTRNIASIVTPDAISKAMRLDKTTHPAAAQPSRAEVLTDAARDVLAERQRQITEKGHTVDDDAIYNDQGQMSYAAAGLAVLASEAATDIVCGLTGGLTYDDECIGKPEQWPHGWKYKPATPRRNLVVAAAFLIAEIERIDYVTEKP
jgi:hypothetical protein